MLFINGIRTKDDARITFITGIVGTVMAGIPTPPDDITTLPLEEPLADDTGEGATGETRPPVNNDATVPPAEKEPIPEATSGVPTAGDERPLPVLLGSP